MSVRETINSHPAWGGALVVIVVGAIVFTLLKTSRVGVTTDVPAKAYFTTDDSSPAAAKAALFADSSTKLPPFRKDGKTAYLACVFSCDGGKTSWVAYLERFTPQRLDQLHSESAPTDAAQSLAKLKTGMQGIEVKRPGDREWTDFSDMSRAARITNVRCPDGSSNNLVMITP